SKLFSNDSTIYKDMILLYKVYYYKFDELKNKRVAEVIYAPYILPDEPLIHRFLDIPFDSLPFRSLQFTTCNDRLMPIPTLVPLITYSNILEVFLTKIVKSSNTLYKKLLVDATFMQETDFEEKYGRARDEIIPINVPSGKTISQMIYEPGNRAAEVLQIMTSIYEFTNQKADEITMQTRNMQGGEMSGGTRTATEAMILNEWATVTANANVSKVSKVDEEICYDYNLIVDTKYSRQDIVEITLDNSAEEFENYGVEELYGKFSIKILTGSESKAFKQLKYQKAEKVYRDVASSMLSTGEQAINNLKNYLMELDVEEDVINNIVDPPIPLRSGWDEFGLLINKQTFEPQEREDFDEHLQIHAISIGLIEYLPIDEDLKNKMKQFLVEHIENTHILRQKVENNKSSKYIPQNNQARLDNFFPGTMNRDTSKIDNTGRMNMITNQRMPGTPREILNKASGL
ncbi:MAG: hypothetical protein KKH44_04485, partial [Bacteroidetes bacterium]|nr:hypothetical protein [Bacteroidota bacterium]